MRRCKSASLQVCKSFIGSLQPPFSNFHFPSPIFLLLAILLLASFLRFYRLDAQSFWNDEGNSARIAERPVRLVVEGAAGDIHPPGYYLLLHCWRALAGQSEFALRSLSVVTGVLLVAFTYLLGRRLSGRTTGLIAAFLAAISPCAVYYSQEARMYALLGALSAASTVLLLRVVAQWRVASLRVCKCASVQVSNFHFPFSIFHFPTSIFQLPISYVLLAAAGLYTQYAFAFVLLVHNAIFGLWWLSVGLRSPGRWRWLAAWVGAQALIAVLYLPWLPIALRATGWPSAGAVYSMAHALLDVLGVLTVGPTLPQGEATAALVGASVLLLLGLWARRAKWFGVATLAIYLLLPIALLFAFDLYKPAWLKFLVVVLPPFHILVARGVENLAQSANRLSLIAYRHSQFAIRHSPFAIRFLAITFFAIATYPSLRNLYFNPAYARDDYRQIAADVSAAHRPGDAIILDAPNQWEVFTYYTPDRDVYPAPYHPTPEQAEEFLAPLVGRYQRLFVLYWGNAESDPQRLVETWLATHAYPSDDRWYGRVRLAVYGVAALPEEPAVPLDARFGENIRLRGYTLADEQFAPGDVLPVTLFWEAQVPVAERYKVTVQVLDGAGQLVAQHDAEPLAGFAPTDAWQPGQSIADRHGVLLPASLAPGRYTLVVALYHIASGERLPATLDGAPMGDHLTLTEVEMGE